MFKMEISSPPQGAKYLVDQSLPFIAQCHPGTIFSIEGKVVFTLTDPDGKMAFTASPDAVNNQAVSKSPTLHPDGDYVLKAEAFGAVDGQSLGVASVNFSMFKSAAAMAEAFAAEHFIGCEHCAQADIDQQSKRG